MPIANIAAGTLPLGKISGKIPIVGGISKAILGEDTPFRGGVKTIAPFAKDMASTISNNFANAVEDIKNPRNATRKAQVISDLDNPNLNPNEVDFSTGISPSENFMNYLSNISPNVRYNMSNEAMESLAKTKLTPEQASPLSDIRRIGNYLGSEGVNGANIYNTIQPIASNYYANTANPIQIRSKLQDYISQ
jgi:hypothetical protein